MELASLLIDMHLQFVVENQMLQFNPIRVLSSTPAFPLQFPTITRSVPTHPDYLLLLHSSPSMAIMMFLCSFFLCPLLLRQSPMTLTLTLTNHFQCVLLHQPQQFT